MFRYLALALAFGVTACESYEQPPSATAQKWLCGREYVNHAWGYQRHGTVIDASGTVLRYDIRSAVNNLVNPWSPKDALHMSEDELKLRYNGATATERKVPAADIAKNYPLIAEAARAKPTDPKMTAADMGQHLTYCLAYDEVTHSYSEVMIDNRGDWTSTNPSPAARTLSAWLDQALGPEN
ncbi:MAG: hypothetical protein ABL973_08725 [Micropepsaceae bacterium]